MKKFVQALGALILVFIVFWIVWTKITPWIERQYVIGSWNIKPVFPNNTNAITQKQQNRVQIKSIVSPARNLTGQWSGSFTFTNNCPNPAYQYIGKKNPPSLTMNLKQNGNIVTGTVTIHSDNLVAKQFVSGMENPFKGDATSNVFNGTISSSHFTFSDEGGNMWSLNLSNDLLKGIISNNQPGCLGIQSSDVSLLHSN